MISVEHRWRRESAAYWAERNVRPAEGEPIFERDTGKFKIGDGVRRYNDLPYYEPASDEPSIPGGPTDPVPPADLSAHINDPTPHPAYDEGPSLLLLYNNAKV